MEKKVTVDNFNEITSTDKPVLLDFWAGWCGPCLMIAPAIEKISEKYADTAVVGKINIDEQRALAEKFGVMSIPTVFVLKGGKVVGSAIGVRPQQYYESMLDKAIAS